MLQTGEALGLLEVRGLTPALLALDALDKAASVRLLQTELNDFNGVVLKIAGDTSSVRAAIESGARTARQSSAAVTASVLSAPDERAWRAIRAAPEINPLLEAPVVRFPNYQSLTDDASSMENYAIGLIETQGFTAVFEAIDAASKAADVQVIGKEKLGGGYITVLIKGDVAAVTAAVEAGRARVAGLGTLIAAHVIARPSEAVLSLVPRMPETPLAPEARRLK
jgi:microcompartment protein CcmL/EutN